MVGIAGAIVVGVPKVQADIPKIPEKADSQSDVFATHEMIANNSTYGALPYYRVTYRGFVYTYSYHTYNTMMRRLALRKQVYGIGNSGSLRTYCANKIVRISDGKVFKDRNGRENASREELDAFYRGKILS
jgi:hypothetical protein